MRRVIAATGTLKIVDFVPLRQVAVYLFPYSTTRYSVLKIDRQRELYLLHNKSPNYSLVAFLGVKCVESFISRFVDTALPERFFSSNLNFCPSAADSVMTS